MAIPFPEPWLRHPRDRSTLAIYDGARLLTEHGELLRASTWRAFRDAVRDHALTVYVRDLMASPLDGALDDPDVQVSTNATGAWQGLTIRAGRRRHHVYASPVAWGQDPSPDLLRDIRTVYRALGVAGAPTTASGLGLASMRRHWTGGPMWRPSWACWTVMRETLIGGRADTLQPGRYVPELYEVDMDAAYPTAAAERVPGGGAVRWTGTASLDTLHHMATAYVYCRVTIHERLPLGPVVLQDYGRDGNRMIPVEPGVYRGWLWWEDMAELRAIVAGPRHLITVEPVHGWYWRRWQRGVRSTRRGIVEEPSPLTSWARVVARARRQLPDGPRHMVKLAAVAGIGRLGGPATSYALVRRRMGPQDRPFVHPTIGPTRLWLHAHERDQANLLIQVASYVQAAVRRRLYRAALPFAQRGTLVATNYDALYLTERPRMRGTVFRRGWKLDKLQDALVPAARSVVSRDKVRLPGVPMAQREGLTNHVVTT